jgi:hypothetical protein
MSKNLKNLERSIYFIDEGIMRKFVSLLLLALLIISCSEEKKDEESAKLPEAKSEQGPVKLINYIFEKGKTIEYKLNTNVSSSQSIESDTSITTSSKQNVIYTVVLEVLNVDDNNIADLSVNINKIVATAEIDGDKVEYDSKYIYSSRERLIYADYEAIKGKSFKVRVSAIGEVLNIYGASKIVNEMISIQGQGQKITSEQRKQFEQGFIDQGLTPMVQQLFKTLTYDKVRVESQWNHKYPSMLGSFQIENIATFQVKEFYAENNDSLAKLNAHLAVRWFGQNQVQEQGINYTFSDPNISGFGTIDFNLSEGWVDKSESTVRMEMEMTMDSFDANQKPVRAIKKDFVESKNKLTRIKN